MVSDTNIIISGRFEDWPGVSKDASTRTLTSIGWGSSRSSPLRSFDEKEKRGEQWAARMVVEG